MFPRIARQCIVTATSRNQLVQFLPAKYNGRIFAASYSNAIHGDTRPKKLLPGREEFASRHIGPREAERDQMLALLGFGV